MKSRIKFGLGDNNREVIEGHVIKVDTDDVRDRIAAGFIEGLAYGSNLCFFEFLPSETGERKFWIYPLAAKEKHRLDFTWLMDQIDQAQIFYLMEACKAKLDTLPKVH